MNWVTRTGPILAAFALIGLTWPASTTVAQTPAGDWSDRLATARLAWQAELEAIAAICDEQELPNCAATTRDAIVAHDPTLQTIWLPAAAGVTLDDDAPELARKWLSRFRSCGRTHADQLLELARQAAADDRGADAFQLMHEALVADPDHELLRDALGYRKDDEGRWIRSAKPIEILDARRRHPTIGWDKDAYRIIRSLHFEIATTDESAGIEVAAILERTYDVWRQVFFERWSSADQLARWLDGKGGADVRRKRHEVILFRDRQQYLDDLAVVPGIEVSTGYYDDTANISFFYADHPAPVSTWRHEIVHQLLQENGPSRGSVADHGHAAFIEGIAMYFESWVDHGTHVTLGGFDSLRLQFARLRTTREGFLPPMEQLDSLSREELQAMPSPNVKAIYSQAAGMAQYLMIDGEGEFRDAFIEFIQLIYQGRAKPDSLATATLPFDQHDRRYREFLRVPRSAMASLSAERLAMLEGLALAESGLRDEDVVGLKECRQLDWLQLSGNASITDATLNRLDGCNQLTDLFADRTAITDAGLTAIGSLTALQSLDLAQTRITDQGLASLTGLPELQALWLEGTAITDDGVNDLLQLSNLQYLDLRGTRISQPGLARLRERFPDATILP